MRWLAFILAAFLSLSALAQGLPTTVSTRVGLGGTFIYSYTASQYQTQLTTLDVVWNNQPASLQGGTSALYFPSGVFSSAYTAVNRVPSQANVYGSTRLMQACGVDGGCPLSWFRANHPTWIIYQVDQLTPAYQFSDTLWIPLDISNAAVQSWIQTNQYLPLFQAGYAAVSVDNVTPRNDFGERGVCSIAPTTGCTADGGTWTQLYTGAVNNDTAFVNNRIAWVQAITAYAHSQGKSAMGNVTYDLGNLTAATSMINAFDIWYDEAGFTGDQDSPAPCNPTNSSSVTGSAWIDKVVFITGLNAGAGPNAYVTENILCPLGALVQASYTNFEMVEWAVASYMIIKNSKTYIVPGFSPAAGGASAVSLYPYNSVGGAWPQFTLSHGAASGAYSVVSNVYVRTFASALALVNPSTSVVRTYDLGASVYHRSDCNRYTGVVTLPPLSGMVLINGEPSKCIP